MTSRRMRDAWKLAYPRCRRPFAAYPEDMRLILNTVGAVTSDEISVPTARLDGRIYTGGITKSLKLTSARDSIQQLVITRIAVQL